MIQIINSFFAEYPVGTSCTKEVVVKLARYCPLCDIIKLSICHIVAQKDPGVIVGIHNIISIDHDIDS